MAAAYDPEQVKALLAASAADLLARILPGGKMEGGEYRAKAYGGGTVAVVMRGSKLGCWQNYGTGQAGRSFLSLVRDVCCQGDHVAAYRWALRFVGGDVGHIPPAAAQPPVTPPIAEPAADNGLSIYLHAATFAWSNPVGLYLQGRGLEPSAFPREPRALRCHPGLWCAERQARLVAMVAPIVSPQTRQQIAIHRTWLEQRNGQWVKARLAAPKKVRGTFKGGLIPLTRGSSGREWGRAPDDDALMLAEGIENALSVAMDEPDWRTAAYVSASNLLALRLPPAMGRVCLIHDRDGENWDVTEARDIALEQWRMEGRRVFTWQPPEGTKDANDYIREAAQ